MRHVLLCLALTACADHPSKLDNASKTDPWTAGSDKDKSDKPAFDLKGILAKVGESIKTPGPYEAPEKSKDFAEGKPHWGVLGLHGGIVEREAFTLRGGGGTELRTL